MFHLESTEQGEGEGKRGERTDPAIFNSLLPTLSVLADTNNDVEPIITSVQALAMSLRTIANEGEGIIFEVVVKFSKRPVAAFIDDFVCSRKVEGLDTARVEGLGQC